MTGQRSPFLPSIKGEWIVSNRWLRAKNHSRMSMDHLISQHRLNVMSPPGDFVLFCRATLTICPRCRSIYVIIHMLYPGRQLSARLARSKWQWRKDGFFRYSVSTEKIVETRDHETGMMCPGRTSGCVLSCSVVAKHALFCTFGRISLYFRIYIKISHFQGEGVLLSSAYGRRPFSSMGFPRKREL